MRITLLFLLLGGLSTSAFAQDYWDPGDGGPCSDPMSPILCNGANAAAAIAREINRREEEGDCTSLGPQGCAALLLHKVLCAAPVGVNAENACKPSTPTAPAPPAPAPAPPAPTPPDPPPPDPTPPDPTPDPTPDPESSSQASGRAAANATGSGLNSGMRAWLHDTVVGNQIIEVPFGRTTWRFRLAGKFEHRRRDAGEYHVLLVGRRAGQERTVRLVLGGQGDTIYALDPAVMRQTRGRRR